MSDQPLTLLCLSHLKWDHVWQRPQQLTTRFAQYCRVIYVDPPEIMSGYEHPQLRAQPGAAGVRVLQPIFPMALIDTPGHSYQELWVALLPAVLDLAGPNTILWVFSPLADYLVAAAQPSIKLAVYDCMDDLASFKGGTPEMRLHESRLLSLVDLVFTGGRSMYEARKTCHAHVHCFPSGVDVQHYRAAQEQATADVPALSAIPQPRLGYFGVLDERIDWSLIASIAERRPMWHWLLIGPTAKVDPAELPVAPNLHYLGQQAYADLPRYLKSFDLATMPFALNEATRFISPTKTLEYLAGGKDVISTSVPDVVATYQGIVTVADGVDAWIAAIERLLAASPAERQERQQRAEPLLEQATWDGIAARMWALMIERLEATERTRLKSIALGSG
ncbi:MAG TPA: glycosyltransferase [Herpetosiphonaceae bacterium]